MAVSAPRPAEPAAADHRLAAVHHQQPQARDRAVHGRRRRLDAGAQCAAGLAARRVAGRDHRDAGRLGPRPPGPPAAPFAINQIVHKSNDRLEHDMQVCAKYKVPIVITSLGARTDVNDAVHAWGGVVLHDIINNAFAHKAIEKGADGLIAVAAGAGGHAGVKSPFALVQEIREWFDGPLALSGAIATGDAVLAAQAMGADFAYIGSAFIATDEARARGLQAVHRRQQQRRHRLLQPVHRRARQLPEAVDPQRRPGPRPPARERPEQDELRRRRSAKKAWKDIWGCGQGIGAVKAVVPAAELVARWRARVRRRRCAREMFCSCAGLGLAGAIADGVGEVRRAVREQVRNGANQIKIMAGGGVSQPHRPDRRHAVLAGGTARRGRGGRGRQPLCAGACLFAARRHAARCRPACAASSTAT
jgi:nitronate monooxygenase